MLPADAKPEGAAGQTPKDFQTASGEPWRLEQVSLAGYAGESALLVRFRLVTDVTVGDDGWYIDDIAIDSSVDRQR